MFFALSGNAQEISKEVARVYAAKTFVSFKNQLSDAFSKSNDYSSFEKIVCGNWKNTTDGKYLLNEAYNHLKSKTSDERLVSNYDGIGIAKALKFQKEVLSKNPKSDGSELFGGPGDGTTGNYNPQSKSYPCKWWQLSCHLDQIFGDGMGPKIIVIILGLLFP